MHVRFQEEVFFQDTFVKQQLNIVETPLTVNSLATRLFTTATVIKVRPNWQKQLDPYRALISVSVLSDLFCLCYVFICFNKDFLF